MAPSWCLLPPEILDLFLQRLPFPDCLTFCKVCHIMATRLSRQTPPHPSTAFLLKPDTSGRLCSLHGGQLLELHSPITNMPQFDQILGSSMGWMVILGCRRLHLLNPITKEQIFLPIFDDTLRWTFVAFHHVVLSTAPSSGDCIIVLRGRIDYCMTSAWCRLSDSKWNLFDVDWEGGDPRDSSVYKAVDMMFYNGKLYLGDPQNFHIFTFCPEMKMIGSVSFPSISESRHWSERKLVQSGSELLLVGVRRHNKFGEEFNSLYHDYPFDIFKLVEEPDKWVRVESLGKRALLIGYTNGTTVESFCTEDLMGSGFEANCIYFLEDA